MTVGARRVDTLKVVAQKWRCGRRIPSPYLDRVHAQANQGSGAGLWFKVIRWSRCNCRCAHAAQTSGTAARQLVCAPALVGAGQITVGAVRVGHREGCGAVRCCRRIGRGDRDRVHARQPGFRPPDSDSK